MLQLWNLFYLPIMIMAMDEMNPHANKHMYKPKKKARVKRIWVCLAQKEQTNRERERERERDREREGNLKKGEKETAILQPCYMKVFSFNLPVIFGFFLAYAAKKFLWTGLGHQAVCDPLSGSWCCNSEPSWDIKMASPWWIGKPMRGHVAEPFLDKEPPNREL